MENQDGQHKLLGEILIAKGLVTEAHVEEALELQQESMLRIGEQLISMGAVSDMDVIEALSEQLNIPIFKVEDVEEFPMDVVELLTYPYLNENKILPVQFNEEEGELGIVHHDPLNIFMVDDLEHKTGYKIKFYIDAESNINKGLKTLASLDTSLLDTASELEGMEVSVDRTKEDAIDLGEAEGPIVRLVNLMISTGINEGASDIHVEPSKKRLRIRYRCSGVLRQLIQIPDIVHQFQPELISRLKLMANMDISERRLPQEGRIKVAVSKGKNLDTSKHPSRARWRKYVCESWTPLT